MKVELLEVLGVACLAAFAAFVWLPACLLVVGVACIVVAWAATTSPSGDDS